MVQKIKLQKQKTGVWRFHQSIGYNVYIKGKKGFYRNRRAFLQFASGQNIKLQKGEYIYGSNQNICKYLKKYEKELHVLGFTYSRKIDQCHLKLIKDSPITDKVMYQNKKFSVQKGIHKTTSSLLRKPKSNQINTGVYYNAKAIKKCVHHHFSFSKRNAIPEFKAKKKQTNVHSKKRYQLYRQSPYDKKKVQLFKNVVGGIVVIGIWGTLIVMSAMSSMKETKQSTDSAIKIEREIETQKKVDKSTVKKEAISKQAEDTSIRIGNVIAVESGISYYNDCINPTNFGNTESHLVQQNNQIYVAGFSIVAYHNHNPQDKIVKSYKQNGVSYNGVMNYVDRLKNEYPSVHFDVKVHLGYIYGEGKIEHTDVNPYQLGWADAELVQSSSKILKR